MAVKKNWLIRTRDFNILGPVSRQKITELIQNGSLDPQDELSSGNGFWFFFKEKDLVDRFVLHEEMQGFNPISESHHTLTAHLSDGAMQPDFKAPAAVAVSEAGDQVRLPSANDLEYPTMPGEKASHSGGNEGSASDHTLVANLSQLGISKGKEANHQNHTKVGNANANSINGSDPAKKKI